MQNNLISVEKEEPFAPPTTSGLKITPDFMSYETGHLTITLWGGIEIHTINRLRATLHIKLKANEYNSFRDTADLYSHSQTDRLIKQASEKLEISTSITNEAITGLTKELESYRQQKREEKRQNEESKEHQSLYALLHTKGFFKKQNTPAGRFGRGVQCTVTAPGTDEQPGDKPFLYKNKLTYRRQQASVFTC